MSELYSQDRVKRLSCIQRSFCTAVRVGDLVEFGLKGDPHFPDEYLVNRPTGKVIRVKRVGTDGASIRVKLTTGSVVDVMPYSLDPRRVWEFTDVHFPEVVKRTQPAEDDSSDAPRVNDDHIPADMVRRSDYDNLLAKVDAISSRLEKESIENRNFNGAMVASFAEIANGSNTPFCKSFTEEYKTMIEEGPLHKTASPFDSDFSDSDDG